MQTSYELLYIISAAVTDDEVGKIEASVKALIEKYGATVESMSRLGKFRLAYAIKETRHGHYILVRFSSEGKDVAKIEEALRITPEVVRHLILRADEVGSDRFELVQFTEVNLDNKESSDERPRRRREDVKEEKPEEAKKPDAEGATPVAAAPVAEAVDADLTKKIESALEEKV